MLHVANIIILIASAFIFFVLIIFTTMTIEYKRKKIVISMS